MNARLFVRISRVFSRPGEKLAGRYYTLFARARTPRLRSSTRRSQEPDGRRAARVPQLERRKPAPIPEGHAQDHGLRSATPGNPLRLRRRLLGRVRRPRRRHAGRTHAGLPPRMSRLSGYQYAGRASQQLDSRLRQRGVHRFRTTEGLPSRQVRCRAETGAFRVGDPWTRPKNPLAGRVARTYPHISSAYGSANVGHQPLAG